MQLGQPMAFDQIKSSLQELPTLSLVNQSTETKEGFIKTLSLSHFTPPQLIELITKVQDTSVKTLLILFLLSQSDYLERLKGESIIMRLSKNERHISSRLNALITQMDLRGVPESILQMLQPESAVSILCCISQFHRLSNATIDILLGIYPQPAVIFYWLNHFAAMPNGYNLLAHFMQHERSHAVPALLQMPPRERERIITQILEHLELYQNAPKILLEKNDGGDEDHEQNRLIQAINHYVVTDRNEAYKTYINRLASRLIDSNYSFSLKAIQQLMLLRSLPEFKDLSIKSAYLTNYYLRYQAQKGDINFFYINDRLDIDSFVTPVKAGCLMHSSEESTLATITSHSSLAPWSNVPESSFIKQLVERNESLTYFDYFLIHFKGNPEQAGKLLNDYLDYCDQEGCTEDRRLAIHNALSLINSSELDDGIKEVLFDTMLRHPDLYDAQVSYELFLFNAPKVIQNFGLKGGDKNYNRVIQLCDWALSKLSPVDHPDIISVATRARAEALLEMDFSKSTGLFATLIIRLKRCWICGWTGFFSPKLPLYVAPALTFAAEPESHDILVRSTSRTSLKSAANFSGLLMETSIRPTADRFAELTEALNKFSFKPTTCSELSLRKDLDEFFHRLLMAKYDTYKRSWLSSNMDVLITNRFRLIELLLMEGEIADLKHVLKQIRDSLPTLRAMRSDTEDFSSLMSELDSAFPEYQPPESGQVKTTSTAEELLEKATGYVEKASTLATDTLNWVQGLRWFSSPRAQAPAADTMSIQHSNS